MSSERERAVYRMQSDFCRALTNPIRLEILHLLGEGERTVTALATLTKLRQANVSQHLAVMRRSRVIKERREGNNVYYSLANAKITEACGMIRCIMTEQLIKEFQTARSGQRQ